jgi:phenylalanyl-tRNA synthetase beta chain
MLLSKKWLSQYIDLSHFSAEEIAETLTQLGLEVESVESLAPLHENVVVGYIKKASPHPNADSLQVCEVSIADSLENLSIVCGAKNAREGIYVAVAQVGSILPGDFKIKKGNIRSIPSFGMLCSGKELGISDEDAGILELPSSSSLGKKVSEIFDTSDSIFDVSLTPNRSDCLSYRGIARDLGAKLGKKLFSPSCEYKPSSFKTAEEISSSVENKEACSRLVTLVIKNVTPASSPLWLVKALEKSGMRSINLIVDLTNYVMLELGQPIHAYDKKTLNGGKLVSTVLKKAQKFTTLDGKIVDLLPGDIVMMDGEKIVAIAGVMGGKDSEVTDTTKDIVIEVAQFSPPQVRATSKRLGLHTDASHRFERGIDIENIPFVAKRLASLIQSTLKEVGVPDCEVALDVQDIYPNQKLESFVTFRLDRARKILALPLLTIEECVSFLESLGLKLFEKKEDQATFSTPSWRHDLAKEIDLIEEVGRLIGLDKIPNELPSMNIRPNEESPFISFQDHCRFLLASLGMSEVITYPFSSEEDYKNLLCKEEDFLWPRVKLANPLSENESFMQTSLVPSLLKSVHQNRNYSDDGSKLFEVGRAYFEKASFSSVKRESDFFKNDLKTNYFESDKEKVVFERNLISGVLDSVSQGKTWQGEETRSDFFKVKGILENFFHALNIKYVEYRRPDERDCPFLHPGASAVLYSSDLCLGFVGELHPRVALSYDLGSSVPVLFELDLDRCLDAVSQKVSVETTEKKYPAVSRDLSFLVSSDLSFFDFKACVLKNPRKKYMTRLELFDVYEGEGVAEGKKSFAARYFFQASDKTLGENDIKKEVDSLLRFLGEQLGAEQR